MQINGTEAPDSLTGTSGDDLITGNGGNDTIKAGTGNDRLEGGAGADRLEGEGGNDVIQGGLGMDADTLLGGAGNDTLSGAGGADRLEGGDGADQITMSRGNLAYGGLGDDFIRFDQAGSDAIGRLFVDGGGGADELVLEFGTYEYSLDLWLDQSTATGVEIRGVESIRVSGVGFNVTVHGGANDDFVSGGEGLNSMLGGGGDDTLKGGAEMDTLVGGLGDDVLRCGHADVLMGGAGLDTIDLSDFGDRLSFNMATGDIGGSTITLSSMERILGAADSDDLTGDKFDNTINGAGGDDSLYVSLGDDLLIGGAGRDFVRFDSLTGAMVIDMSKLVVTFGGGSTTLREIECVSGGQGADTFIGSAGDDWMMSPNRNGTASYESATGGVNIDLWLAAQNTGSAGVDTLVGMHVIIGSAYADTLAGQTEAETLRGGGGDDLILARLNYASDLWDGGAGYDTLQLRFSGGSVIDMAGTVKPGDSSRPWHHFTGFEWVVGDAEAEIFLASAGNDGVDGGGAAAGSRDRLSYEKATAGVRLNLSLDTAQQTGGSGIDRIKGFLDLIGSSFDDALTGGAGQTFLYGADGTDTLFSGGGGDVLDGDAGADTVSYAQSKVSVVVDLAKSRGQAAGWTADTLVDIENAQGGSGVDSLRGNTGGNRLDAAKGDDLLQGFGGADSLIGGAGRDTLIGGVGADEMTGGKHRDVFIFQSIGESTPIGPDHITDLRQGDIIDLSTIDAATRVAGDQALQLVQAFTGHVGELMLTYDALTDITHLLADLNGDRRADFEVLIDGDRHAFHGIAL